jgi:hypothetical protein
VGAGADQEIDVLGRVVQRVKPPHEGNLMGPAMPPVKAQIGDDECREPAQPDWPGRGRGVDTPWNEAVSGIGRKRQWEDQQQMGHEPADKVEAHIFEYGFTTGYPSSRGKKILGRRKNDA